MVKVTLSNGKILWFPETMSDDEIRKRVAEEEKPKTDLLRAAKHGLWQGIGEIPAMAGGTVGFIEDIIPGKQQGIEDVEQSLKNTAQSWKDIGGEEQPDTFAEKVVSGLAAAPGSLLSMAAPVGLAAAAIPAEAGIGAAMASGALGFGAYSALRAGGEGLPASLGEGLRGAAEGAAFGGIGGLAGRYGGKEAAAIMRQVRRAVGPDEAEALLKAAAKAAESKSLQRRLIHAAGGGGVVAASGLSRGENLEDALASGAAMGLLGLKSGAYRPKDVIGGERLIKVEREAEKMAEELRKKREEEGVVEPPVEAATDTIIPPLEAAPVETKQGTLLGFEQYKPMRVTPEKLMRKEADKFLENEPLREKPTSSQERILEWAARDPKDFVLGVRRDMMSVEGRKVDTEYNPKTGKIDYKEGNEDAALVAAQDIMRAVDARQKVIDERLANAKSSGDSELIKRLQEESEGLNTQMDGIMMEIFGIKSRASSAMRMSWLPESMKGVAAAKKFVKTNKELTARVRKVQRDSRNDPKIIADLSKALTDPSLYGSVYEVWINGLLSGIPTQVVNNVSNAAKQALSVLENSAAIAIDAARARASGVPRTQYKSELYGEIMGRKMGHEVGKKAFLASLRAETERITYDEPFLRNVSGPMDYTKHAIQGKMGAFVRLPSRLLSAFDMYFKGMAGMRAGYTEAMRIARETNPTGDIKVWSDSANEIMQNLDPKTQIGKRILKAQTRAAEEHTFTESPAMGSAPYQIMKMREVGVGNVKPLAYVLPFVNVPWNIIRAAVRRSPLGFFEWKNIRNTMKDAAENYDRATQAFSKGKIDEAQLAKFKFASDEATRAYNKSSAEMFIGNAVFLGIMGLAKAGAVTGGGPSDPNEKRNLLDTGWKPYAFKVGDQYISLARIEPLGTVLGMAADAVEASKEDFNSEEFYGKIWSGIKDNLAKRI